MKLVIAVVQDQDANRLVDGLLEAGFTSTKLASTGGFLKEGNTTLLIGVDEAQVPKVLDIITHTCKSRKQLITPIAAVGRSISAFIPRPVEITVGGATVFVLNVEQFEKV